MEKVLKVVPVTPWLQPFWVHSIIENKITETYVFATETYEWGCKTCKEEEDMYCVHVRSVREFVYEEMIKEMEKNYALKKQMR